MNGYDQIAADRAWMLQMDWKHGTRATLCYHRLYKPQSTWESQLENGISWPFSQLFDESDTVAKGGELK